MINEEQVEIIKEYLLESGISNVALRDDLLDHISCIIDEKMGDSISFEESFADAIQRVAPDGPAEIEKELNFLLTIKTQIMLRKIVFTSSYISVLTVLIGIALRVPGIIEANLSLLLIMVGILLFSVSTVPYFFFTQYDRSVKKLREV